MTDLVIMQEIPTIRKIDGKNVLRPKCVNCYTIPLDEDIMPGSYAYPFPLDVLPIEDVVFEEDS